MAETKWNIKKTDIKEPEPDIKDGEEGFDNENSNEISEIEQKLQKMRNERKGFMKSPALDSVYTPDPDTGPVIEGMVIEGARGSRKKAKGSKGSSKKKTTTTSTKTATTTSSTNTNTNNSNKKKTKSISEMWKDFLNKAQTNSLKFLRS